jgi:hypothetical protein
MKENLIRLGFAFFTLSIVVTNNQPTRAALVGQWTFEGPNPLTDQTGNFSALVLQGNASIFNGQLDLNGTGTTPTGWAYASNYTGPTITSKTLVSWLKLQNLGPYAGSPLGIRANSIDRFDSIVYGELQTNRWMAGSNIYARTQNFSPGFQETTTDQLIQIAIAYNDLGSGQMQISGYRNGSLIGTYLTANASTYSPGGVTVDFGPRSAYFSSPRGSLDALIEESRIYDTALTQSQIAALQPLHVPAPLPVVGSASALGYCRRLRRQSQRLRSAARNVHA